MPIKESASSISSFQYKTFPEEETTRLRRTLEMWGDLFRDPWFNSFPRVQTTGNPIVGFGGFYGERPRSFWKDPVYFPSEKPRRLSNRKKTGRVVEEDRQFIDDERSIPIHREKPSDKKVKKDKEDEEQTCPLQPKFSHHVRDVPIPIEIQFGDESGLNEGFERTSSKEAHCDESKQLSNDQASSVEPTCTEKEEKGALDINQTAAVANDSQSEIKTAEEQKKLDEIESVLAKAKELSPRVEAFTGSKQDKEYLYLEEHLTRCILSLDLVETDGQEQLKSARRAAVKEILSIVNDIEARVPEKLD